MSRDVYQGDRVKHGAPHVDRYNPKGTLVGRYRLDRTPIVHRGRTPPAVPRSDFEKFEKAAARARGE